MLPDHPKEACGLFGVFGHQQSSALIYQGIFSLQHRGQEAAGIVTADGEKVRSSKGLGLVSEVFAKKNWQTLQGHLGIGHVRYSTTGSSRIQNVQPLVVECTDGIWAVAHNGNLVNARALRRMYQNSGAIFQTSTDSEVLVHLLADPMYRSRPRRVERALSELEGAFSFLIMTKDKLMAARDPGGFRPLSIGKIGDCWVFASETCALNQVGAEYVRDVAPGELATVGDEGFQSSSFADCRHGRLSQCVFEMVYFARPDSVVFGHNVHLVRMRYGEILAQEEPVEADMVISVPDSGNSSALGFSKESTIPLNFGFIRNHYVGRTFIMPEIEDRVEGVDMKLAVLEEVVRNQRVVVVDDSIVRGTTARRRVRSLRRAGAKEIHVRIASPPTRYPCYFGIDFPTREELIAASKDIDNVCRYLEADSLGYLSVEGLLSPFAEPGDFCSACFCGEYPVNVSGMENKKIMETNVCEDQNR